MNQPCRQSYLSPAQLAATLGVSKQTIFRWIRANRIPFLRLSAKSIRFDPDRVLAALAPPVTLGDAGSDQ